MPFELLTTTRLDAIETLAQLLALPRDWDVLIHADGSGAGWDLPTGYGAVLYDRQARGRKSFYGGHSIGTINIAELEPFGKALSWHAEYRRRLAVLGRAGKPFLKVACVTDHAAIVEEGHELTLGRKPVRAVRTNRPEWARLLAYEWDGYVLSFHGIERATTALNCWADAAAKLAFHAMKTMPPPMADGHTIDVYDCNPDDPAAAGALLEFLTPKQPKRRRRGRPRVRTCPSIDAE